MYWSKNDDGLEVLDGQQRTISICQYLSGYFSVLNANGNPQYFHNIQSSNPDEAQRILDYKLTVYECEGDDTEKLDWFKIINIAGAVLTEQELRNAVYTGAWLSDAKRYFSRKNCAAYNFAKDFVSGDVIRQDFLKTAIEWSAMKDNIAIEEYMARHQNDADAQELWMYFQEIIDWIKRIFPTVRKEMKGLNWGKLYLQCKDKAYNAVQNENKIKELMDDPEVTQANGIYEYILTGHESALSLRSFYSDKEGKRIIAKKYDEQHHKCPFCDHNEAGHTYPAGVTEYALEEMQADHIIPWSRGGKTIEKNCQLLCEYHNKHKSDS